MQNNSCYAKMDWLESTALLCRLCKGHAGTNFSTLRRTALGLLKNESTAKVGINNKRLTSACDETYLEKVLQG